MSDKQGQTASLDGNLQYTGERHIPSFTGVELLPMAHIEHMVRYAFVTPFVQGKRVLDLSCGSGYGTQYMALQGATTVVGVDIDQPSLDYAQMHHAHPAVTYLQSDAHSVPELADHSFDVIVSFETIEHLQQPRNFLVELKRLLKPDGQLFISCPNDYRVSPWISEYHLHKFRFEEFRDLVVTTFGAAQFLGQHHAIASCLTRPISTSDQAQQFGPYREAVSPQYFPNAYVEHLSSIENADAYIGLVGVSAEAVQRSLSVSQQAFQALMAYCKDLVQQTQDVTQDFEVAQAKQAQDFEVAQAKQAQDFEVARAKQAQDFEMVNQQVVSQQQMIEALREKVALLEERNGQLLRAGAVSANVQAELDSKQWQLDYANNLIMAMETSKFWQMRQKWFKLKQRLHLSSSD